jgi:hypothetical protein
VDAVAMVVVEQGHDIESDILVRIRNDPRDGIHAAPMEEIHDPVKVNRALMVHGLQAAQVRQHSAPWLYPGQMFLNLFATSPRFLRVNVPGPTDREQMSRRVYLNVVHTCLLRVSIVMNVKSISVIGGIRRASRPDIHCCDVSGVGAENAV